MTTINLNVSPADPARAKLFPDHVEFALTRDLSAYRGWDILAIIDDETLMPASETIGVAEGCPNNSGYGFSVQPTPMYGTRNYVVRSAQFLVGRSEHSVAIERDELQARVDAAKKANHESLTACAEMRAKCQEEERWHGETALQLRDAQIATNVQRDRANKLEKDLAKLRQALGERAIKDALTDTP